MTDPELTPAEERVRRLLADARHTEPMPADVVARLDAVLAELTSEGGSAATDASVAEPEAPVSLAARRRRNFTGLLVAAAVVALIGAAGPTLIDGSVMNTFQNETASSSDAGGSAEDGDAADAAPEAGDTGADADSASPDAAARDPKPTDTASRRSGELAAARALAASAVTVRPEQFRRDARRFATDSAAPQAAKVDALLLDCAGDADWGAGVRVPASYDGRLGALVYRTPSEEGQQVELFLCGVDGPVRSTVLPVR